MKMNRLVYEIMPVVNWKDEEQPCRTCLFRDQCNGAFDLEYVWIDREHYLLICAWRMRDLCKERIEELIKVLVRILMKKIKSKEM